MTGIWTNTGQGWDLGSPQPFVDEATLQSLIQRNPQLLPLAGSPSLTVLGAEVQLGPGYADLLAVESSGRPAIIEVKLSSNRDARRAVVSQVLAYAAFLRGHDIETLERGPLQKHLAKEGYDSILSAVQDQDQEGAVDSPSFLAALQECLDQGSFRLVLVLDEVSVELERVVAYLDALTLRALTIDLITLKVYEVNGAQVALPQRVSPDIDAAAPLTRTRHSATKGALSDGSDAFRASVEDTSGEVRAMFESLIEWAEELTALPHVRLFSYAGRNNDRFTLLPRIIPDNAGLVTIWNDGLKPYIAVWRSVFERRAPQSIESVERLIAPKKLGQGTVISQITREVLDALTAAYKETTDHSHI